MVQRPPAGVMASDPNSSTRLKVLSPAFAHRVTAILVDAGLFSRDDMAGSLNVPACSPNEPDQPLRHHMRVGRCSWSCPLAPGRPPCGARVRVRAVRGEECVVGVAASMPGGDAIGHQVGQCRPTRTEGEWQ
jgi:hypothetical protein